MTLVTNELGGQIHSYYHKKILMAYHVNHHVNESSEYRPPAISTNLDFSKRTSCEVTLS